VTPPYVAVIVTLTGLVTVVVATVNVAVLLPAEMFTVAGTVADVELDDSEITAPPTPIGPLRVTVPVEEFPPTTDVGLSVTLVRVGALMVNVAVFVVLPCVPVIVAVVVEATEDVVTVNVAVVAPAGTVTVPGTSATVAEELRLMTLPPEPAGPPMVTVPVELLPPVTVVGFRDSAVKAGGFTVSVAV